LVLYLNIQSFDGFCVLLVLIFRGIEDIFFLKGTQSDATFTGFPLEPVVFLATSVYVLGHKIVFVDIVDPSFLGLTREIRAVDTCGC
jgi:hypothetical protein